MRNMLNKDRKLKKLDFLGEKNAVEVRKLIGSEVKSLQKDIKALQKLPEEEQGLAIRNLVLRMTVIGAEDMTDDEFDAFPLDDLATLTQSCLEYSGISEPAEGNA